MSKYHERKLYTKNVLSRRNSKIPKTKVYYLTGGCVAIVTLLLTSTKVSQVNNMSKSQCCPLYCHVGWRRAPHRWRLIFQKQKSKNKVCKNHSTEVPLPLPLLAPEANYGARDRRGRTPDFEGAISSVDLE